VIAASPVVVLASGLVVLAAVAGCVFDLQQRGHSVIVTFDGDVRVWPDVPTDTLFCLPRMRTTWKPYSTRKRRSPLPRCCTDN
jgi:hypothetical protein